MDCFVALVRLIAWLQQQIRPRHIVLAVSALVSGMILGIPVLANPPTSAPKALSKTAKAKPQIIIVLHDTSTSMAEAKPPEVGLTAVLHLLDVARLSKVPVQFAVITFGGNEVKVFGDEKGLPTAALGSLRRELISKWPAYAPGTPLDEASEKLINIITALPRDAEITALLDSDGAPSSGRLRPEVFPEVAREMEKLRKKILDDLKDKPAIAQQALSNLERDFVLLETKPVITIFEQQLKFEFEKTLNHVSALKRRHVRVVTLDFAQTEALEHIHRAAGGMADDFLRVPPDQIIPKLHERRIVAMPNVIQLPPISEPKDDQRFDRTTTLRVDAIGEAILLPVVFQPAIEQFERDCRLSAAVEGAQYAFTSDGQQSEALLMRDGQKNVAIGSLMLDTLRPNSTVILRWESPSASRHVPAWTIFPLMRLREDLEVEFRPKFAVPEMVAPFRMAPAQGVTWSCALRVKGQALPIALRGAEAILIDRRTQNPVRIDLSLNPQVPGTFLSQETHLPPGEYDVDLHLILESGAAFQHRLHDQIICAESNEEVLLDVSVAGPETGERTSQSATHLNFGLIGDVVLRRSIDATMRTEGLAYPLTVIPEVSMADRDGRVPQQPWIQCHPGKVELRPGSIANVRFDLVLPKQIDSAISDGVFEGQLVLKHSETGLPLVIKRFKKLNGVQDELPADRVTFELKRPQFRTEMPRAFHNWLITRPDGAKHGVVRIDIAKPYGRDVVLSVTHDSKQARLITILPTGGVVGPNGGIEPKARFVPCEDSPSTQEIAPGQTGLWRFRWEIDGDCPTSKLTTDVLVSSDGFASQHFPINFRQREVMLGPWVKAALWCLVAVLLVLLVSRILIWRFERQFTTGSQFFVTEDQPLPGYLRVLPGHGGTCQLETVQPISWKIGSARIPQQMDAERPTRLAPDSVSETKPVQIQSTNLSEGPVMEIHEARIDPESGTELRVVVKDGGTTDERVWRLGRAIAVLSAGLVAAVVIAVNVQTPIVVEAAQSLLDFLLFV